MSNLILVRHGTSVWNELGLWTGLTDVDLAEAGKVEARGVGELLADIEIDQVYSSTLHRTQQTFDAMRPALKIKEPLQLVTNAALNERDYGTYTGKNKWQVKEEVGEQKFQQIRRGWDVLIPEGESLKAVYERVVPYYQSVIQPQLIAAQQNVLVVAHGNSLRALIKLLENLNEQEVSNLEIGFNEARIYQMNEAGEIVGKEVRVYKV